MPQVLTQRAAPILKSSEAKPGEEGPHTSLAVVSEADAPQVFSGGSAVGPQVAGAEAPSAGQSQLLPGVTARQTTLEPRDGWHPQSSQSLSTPLRPNSPGARPPPVTDYAERHCSVASAHRNRVHKRISPSQRLSSKSVLLHVTKSEVGATRGSAGGSRKASVGTGHTDAKSRSPASQRPGKPWLTALSCL